MFKTKWTKVVLLGDSLTQFSFSPQGCWGSMLANQLQRVADVVCRGLSGYNSRWFKITLPQLMSGIDTSSVSCVTIFLGANDAAHEDCPSGQHVPVEEYKTNLADIVSHLEAIGIKKDRIILLNPPTYYHDDFLKSRPGMQPRRSAQSAASYAAACLEVGKNLDVTTIDIHETFTTDPRGSILFDDGLHFSPLGAELLFNELWPHIKMKILDFTGESNEQSLVNLPFWMDFRNQLTNE